MQIVLILQQLLRMRALVAVIGVLSIMAGGLIAFHPGLPPQSRSHMVGVGSARALIDTPHSQVVDLGPGVDANAGVLPARAVLLANLLTTSPLKEEVAKRAGVRLDHLVAVADTPTDSGAPVQKPLATGAAVSASDPTADVLTAHTDVALPLITVNTQAPDVPTATRLANAALAVLQAHVNSVSGSESVPAQRRLVVKVLGLAGGAEQRKGPSPVIGLLVAIATFVLLCGLLLLCTKVARDWHAAAAIADTEQEWAAPDAVPDVFDDGPILDDEVITPLFSQAGGEPRGGEPELHRDAS